jgi:A/G-specific adenine glycosylase
MDTKFDHQGLIQWFEREKRDLPWRHNPTPYQVWISEVMLQQTQIATVIPYYERWMVQLPTLKDLAQAPLEKVLKLWEGLGYYSRVKNMHAAAKHIQEYHNGQIPSEPHLLAQIKGIGPYTLGAILSFAFHQRHPAVDGNVLRVLSRYFLIEADIGSAKVQRQIRDIAENILQENQPWVMTEALIELGATVCRKVPKCAECPIRSTCKAYSHGMAQQLPYKSKKTSLKYLVRAVAVLQSQDRFLVRQVKEGQIMSGLHEFPYVEIDESTFEFSKMQSWIQSHLGLKAAYIKPMTETRHAFTSYQVKLLPFHFSCKKTLPVDEFKWLSLPELQTAAFPSGHRRIFMQLQSSCE